MGLPDQKRTLPSVCFRTFAILKSGALGVPQFAEGN
jgi:hypothetical protein